MKIYTYEELKNMSVTELCKLCETYGMSTRSIRTFTYKQMIAFVRGHQLFEASKNSD